MDPYTHIVKFSKISGPKRLVSKPRGVDLQEAISYIYLGHYYNCSSISVNGCIFLITPNVEAVLKRFRHPDNKRYLWIDGVCINQSDIPERNYQVTNMHWVSQCTEQVIVWLGPHSEDSHAAIDQLEILGCEHGRDFFSRLEDSHNEDLDGDGSINPNRSLFLSIVAELIRELEEGKTVLEDLELR